LPSGEAEGDAASARGGEGGARVLRDRPRDERFAGRVPARGVLRGGRHVRSHGRAADGLRRSGGNDPARARGHGPAPRDSGGPQVDGPRARTATGRGLLRLPLVECNDGPAFPEDTVHRIAPARLKPGKTLATIGASASEEKASSLGSGTIQGKALVFW